MNTITRLTLALSAALVISISGCKPPDDNNTTTPSGYLVGYRTSGSPTADYFLKATDLKTGVISATGNGVELGGWSYYGIAGNTFFSMEYDNNICVGFYVENGELKERGRFAFERMDCMTEGDDNTMIAIGAPWGGGSFDCQIQLVDANDVSIHNNKKTPIYVSYDSAGAQLNAWPTHSYIDGGKLYISFYPLNGESWETPLTDTAYVSVYSYPALEYLHTFKDTRTGPIGYYGNSPAIVEDEGGNHYTFSNTSIAGGFTKSTKPSGILRINSGAEEFDAGYFFDVEALGYRILTGTYAGNGKVVARVISTTQDQSGAQWDAFLVNNAVCRIAILDLTAKTISIINEIPLHGGQYQTPFYHENDKVYMSVSTPTESYIYEIDPVAGSAVKGARIEGSELQSIFKY